jgi:hypothetical protein
MKCVVRWVFFFFFQRVRFCRRHGCRRLARRVVVVFSNADARRERRAVGARRANRREPKASSSRLRRRGTVDTDGYRRIPFTVDDVAITVESFRDRIQKQRRVGVARRRLQNSSRPALLDG